MESFMKAKNVSRKLRTTLISALTATGLCFSGCGNSSQQYVYTGPQTPGNPGVFHLIFQNEPSPAGVDSVQLVFKDANGQPLGQVQELPFSKDVSTALPAGATSVEVDYLRNGGYALFESSHPLINPGVNTQALAAQTTITDPQLAAAAKGRSIWTTQVNPANFKLSANGNPGQDTGLSPATNFKVKGVAYSPTSIGVNVALTPHLGDYFWDGGQNIQGAGILKDWELVWKRDIENIRNHFNAIRVYTMLAVHLNDNGSFPNFSTPNVRTHLKFLDALWNNNDRPIYCMVGIPVNPGVYLGTASPAEVQFWNENITRIVAQLKDHPAVMGFTIFNEAGGGNQWGGSTPDSQTYWTKVQAYAQQIKAAAPDKLVGFAYFDAPGDVTQANQAGLLETYGSDLDFWGINAAQAQTLSGTLAPYHALTTAAKPVLFTELGNPASTHTNTDVCSGDSPTQAGVNSITVNDQSIVKAAQALANVLPLAMTDDVVAGAMVFEWSDEYWKQSGSPGCFEPRGPEVQDGGKIADLGAKANGFDDEEAYGLHGISLSKGRAASDVFSPFGTVGQSQASNLNPDTLTLRKPMMDAVDAAFAPLR